MKRTLLSIALAIAAPAAFAADGAATATPAATNPDAARAEMAQLQRQMQELSRRMAELSLELGDVGPRAYALRYLGEPDRAMLGVVLTTDSDGVRIEAVTPDGAAARAGLHDGDVITSINGTPLAHDSADRALAAARTQLGNLKDGQEVRLGWQRGGKAQAELTLKAERRTAWNWAQLMSGDAEHPLLPKDFKERMRADVERAQRAAERAARQAERETERSAHEADRARAAAERATARIDREQMRELAESSRRAVRLAMPWWGLNLAPVNADLGRYFGVTRGALVLATDAEALPGLRAGDVITRIANEPVTRPEDALRALRDQPAGSSVAVTLMRERKTVTLNVKAPEFKSIFAMPPLPPEPPTPPAAPQSPKAVPTAPTPPVPPAPPAVPHGSPRT